MKKIFFGLLLIIALDSFSQNLVPNLSFEILDSCNIPYLNAINYGLVPNWTTPTQGTSDIYNICSSSAPNTWIGFQNPHSGNGFAGAIFWSYSLASPDYREYIQAKLDTSMINQEHYCVSFYVNRASNCQFACNNIGIYFSDHFVSSTTYSTLNFIPQIIDTSIITDTLNWTIIYGEYVASGTEQYLIIGNFYPDSLTDSVYTGGIGNGSGYYFIDDVNVHCCTCDSTTSLHAGVTEMEEANKITLFPNPTSTIFTITSTDKIESVRVYNMLGELLGTESPNNHQLTININQLPQGIYFVEVHTEKRIVRKKVVKE